MNDGVFGMYQLLLRISILVIFFLVPINAIQAAEITFTPELKPRLSALKPIYAPPIPSEFISDSSLESLVSKQNVITISGIIEKGDAAKLERLMTSGEHYYSVIIFNSVGGSFLEGIRIGEMFQANMSSQDPSLAGVFVLDGQACLSACALAFSMSSAIRTLNGDSIPDTRYVEKGAKLGFHMGILPENLLAQKAEVQDIMNLTYDVVAAYTKLIKGNLNPEVLLEESLKHRTADSFFYLNGGVRTYNLGFTPVSNSNLTEPVYDYAMSIGNISGICKSVVMASPIRKTLVTYGYLYIDGNGGLKDDAPITDLFQLLNTDKLAATMVSGEICFISRHSDRQLLIEVRESGRSANCVGANTNNQSWCAADHRAGGLLTVGILSDTYKCVDDQLVTQFESWGIDADIAGDLIPGPFPDRDGWKRTISREVNARSEPSLKGSIKTKLQKDSKVQVTGCKITAGSQGVWYQVKTKSGDAWISSRFVSETLDYYRPYQ